MKDYKEGRYFGTVDAHAKLRYELSSNTDSCQFFSGAIRNLPSGCSSSSPISLGTLRRFMPITNPVKTRIKRNET